MKQRIITAIVAMLIFLPAAFLGGLPFTILIYAMASIALFELLRMRKISLRSVPGMFSLILLWILLLPFEYIPVFEHIDDYVKLQLIIIGVLIFLSYSVFSKNEFTFDDIGFCFMAIIYIGVGFYYMLATRAAGILYIFFALLLIWATDSGAYFFGRAFGKRKLLPSISPNKTVEGAIGGIISAIAGTLLFFFFTDLHDYVQLPALLLVAIVLSVFGQIGDLVESALKRYYNVKDSGNLLPGHGGILDRVDSWLFVFPLLHFLLLI